MKNILLLPINGVKNFIVSNKKLYLISAVSLLVGLILGIYLVLVDAVSGEIYSTVELELSEIILGETGFFSLFFKNLWMLVVPLILIYFLNTTKFTSILSFFYLSFQGILLGISVTTLITESNVAGVLNSIFLVIPINLVNFFVIVSWIVVSYKRMIIAKSQKLSLMYSTKVFLTPFLSVLLGGVVASFLYAIIYPLLLKSVVVIPLM